MQEYRVAGLQEAHGAQVHNAGPERCAPGCVPQPAEAAG